MGVEYVIVARQAISGVMVNSSFPPVNYTIQDVNCSNSYSYDLQSCSYSIANSSVCGVGGSSSIAGAICRESKFCASIRKLKAMKWFKRETIL